MHDKSFKRLAYLMIFLELWTLLFPRTAIRTFASSFEVFDFAEDTGVTSGDSLYGAGFVRHATSSLYAQAGSNNFTAGTDGDYALAKVSEIGAIFTHDVPIASSTALGQLDVLWDTQRNGTASHDIDAAGFRTCELVFALDSYGVSTQEIQYYLQTKNPLGFYFNQVTGFWGKFLFDDTAVTATTSISTGPFPCPTSTFRIFATTTAGALATGFSQASTTLLMRN